MTSTTIAAAALWKLQDTPAGPNTQNVANLQLEIATLQSKVASLQVQLVNAQTALRESQLDNEALESAITNLQNTVLSLQSQLQLYTMPHLTGAFTWINSCPLFFGACSYITDGAYANVGGATAISAHIEFKFYSGYGATGQVLCSTTYVIGSVAAGAIRNMPTLTCQGDLRQEAVSSNYAFVFS